MDLSLTPQRVLDELAAADVEGERWQRLLDRAPMPSLVGALRIAADPDTRRAVLDLLGFRKARAAIPNIIEHLGDPDVGVRAAAADALGKAFGHVGRPAPAERIRAGLAALRTRWAAEPADDVRSTLAQTLALVGDRSVRPLLEAALHDPCEQVQDQARWGLAHLDEVTAGNHRTGPRPAPGSNTPARRTGVDPTLTPTRILDGLPGNLDPDDPAHWRSVARIELAAPIRSLTAALTVAEHPSTRAAIIGMLGNRHARSAVPELIAHLANPDPMVRAFAADAMGKVFSGGDRPAPANLTSAGLAALRARWEDETDGGARAMLAQSLAMLGDQSVRPLLDAALTDHDDDVREEAHWGLRYLDGLAQEGFTSARWP